MAVKIAISNLKGGVGKTCTTLALADILGRRGYKVLIIDTDPQMSATLVCKAETEDIETLYDIIYNNTDAKDCIQHTDYCDIIPCDGLLDDADTHVKQGPGMFKLIKKSLRSVEKNYDFILFDTHPKMGILLGNVMMASDYILCPVGTDILTIQGLVSFSSKIAEYKTENENLEILGLLVIKYKANQKLAGEMVKTQLPKIAEQMGTVLLKSKIRECVKVQEASSLQIPLTSYAPKCTAAQDYEALADEILEITGIKYSWNKKILE